MSRAHCKCVLHFLQPISDGRRDVALKQRQSQAGDADAMQMCFAISATHIR